MTVADRVSVLVSAGRKMRGVATLQTMDPGPGEPWGLNPRGKPAKGSLYKRTLEYLLSEPSKYYTHFTCYRLQDDDGPLDRAPRMTKDLIGQVREAGAETVAWGVAIDWDLKDHPPLRSKDKVSWDSLTDEQKAEAVSVIDTATEKLDELGCPWNVYYTTQNGARFIHVLPEEVPAGRRYERLALKVRDLYRKAGLNVDEACKDWTRLFAAPNCTMEDGTKTWETDWLQLEEQWDEFYIPDDEDLNVEPEPIIKVKHLDVERPDPDAAQSLLEALDERTGKWKLTEAAKAAKRQLLQDPVAGCADSIYNFTPLATEGGRHTTLLGSVGEVISRIYGFPWATPELVYGLLYRPAIDLGKDGDGTPFLDKLWEMTTSIWAKEEAKAAARKVVAEEIIAEREAPPPVEVINKFTSGVRRWLQQAEGKTDAEAEAIVRDQQLGILFDQARDRCHVLLPSGYYETHHCTQANLRQVITERGMKWLVPVVFSKENDRGDIIEVALKPETIREKSGRSFAFSEFTMECGGSHLMIDESGMGIFKHVPFWRRDDIPSRKHDCCFKWLELLTNNPREFLQALGCFLAIEHGPTAAISLVGPKRTGKTLLGIGLGECFNTQRVVPGDVLVAKHNEAMAWSPIVHVEEGISKGSSGIDFSHVFRRIVTGGAFTVEPKGSAMLRMVGAHRIIMTANNFDIISSLSGGQARTTDDWEAIQERIAHFDAQEAAAEYLAFGDGKRRGFDWTASWVGPNSDFELAQTLKWIYENELEWQDGKPKRSGARMLFENLGSIEFMKDLEVEADGIPEIVKAINKALNRRSDKAPAATQDGRIYVMTEKIVQMACEDTKLKTEEIRRALRTLLVPDQPKNRIRVRGRQQRWRAIDQERFLEMLNFLGEEPALAFTEEPSAADQS